MAEPLWHAFIVDHSGKPTWFGNAQPPPHSETIPLGPLTFKWNWVSMTFKNESETGPTHTLVVDVPLATTSAMTRHQATADIQEDAGNLWRAAVAVQHTKEGVTMILPEKELETRLYTQRIVIAQDHALGNQTPKAPDPQSQPPKQPYVTIDDRLLSWSATPRAFGVPAPRGIGEALCTLHGRISFIESKTAPGERSYTCVTDECADRMSDSVLAPQGAFQCAGSAACQTKGHRVTSKGAVAASNFSVVANAAPTPIQIMNYAYDQICSQLAPGASFKPSTVGYASRSALQEVAGNDFTVLRTGQQNWVEATANVIRNAGASHGFCADAVKVAQALPQPKVWYDAPFGQSLCYKYKETTYAVDLKKNAIVAKAAVDIERVICDVKDLNEDALAKTAEEAHARAAYESATEELEEHRASFPGLGTFQTALGAVASVPKFVAGTLRLRAFPKDPQQEHLERAQQQRADLETSARETQEKRAEAKDKLVAAQAKLEAFTFTPTAINTPLPAPAPDSAVSVKHDTAFYKLCLQAFQDWWAEKGDDAPPADCVEYTCRTCKKTFCSVAAYGKWTGCLHNVSEHILADDETVNEAAEWPSQMWTDRWATEEYCVVEVVIGVHDVDIKRPMRISGDQQTAVSERDTEELLLWHPALGAPRLIQVPSTSTQTRLVIKITDGGDLNVCHKPIRVGGSGPP